MSNSSKPIVTAHPMEAPQTQPREADMLTVTIYSGSDQNLNTNQAKPIKNPN